MVSDRKTQNRIATVAFFVTLPLAALVQHLVRSSDPRACPDELSLRVVAVASPSCIRVEHNISLDVLAAAVVATLAWHVTRAYRGRRASGSGDRSGSFV
jgi:hypothetical protein